MRKTVKTLLILGSLGAMCAGLAACSRETTVDKYYKDGNVISVIYDGSGGKILNNEYVYLMDMFNPDKYTPDSEGYIHIKLRSPTDHQNGTNEKERVTVSRTGYSLAGWYQKRELVKDDEGNVLDEEGNKLVEKNERYYKVTITDEGEEKREKTTPAYTFSEPWDFATDTVDFKVGTEKYELTLYAAWVPVFTFEYYYKPGADAEWTKFATTDFDYPSAQTVDRTDLSKVKDCVIIPDWSTETGKMEHKYTVDSAYTFPSLENMTFKAAYADKECTQKITREEPLKHAGYINYDTATSVNGAQPVYVQFDEGNHYRVSTAKQFADINDPTGYFTILSDELDFDCFVDYATGGELSFTKTETASPIRWPSKLTTSTFTGRIEGEGGKKVTFKNVGARMGTSTSTVNVDFGGLFGEIGAGAVIKNVSFENVILDVQNVNSKQGAKFGMFAGNIDDDATVENVTLSGEMRLWKMSGSYTFNLITNGKKAGVTNGGIKLIVCGEKVLGSKDESYLFAIDPDSVSVNADGEIDFDIVNQNTRYKTEQYFVKYGG